jgi:fucose 4-O-acetylase-like acetyltransferase
VVMGHALGGIMDMPGREVPEAFRWAFLAIYVFHMPLFFFLSGVLVQARLARSRHAFLIDLFISVAYPYLLWSVIQYSVIYAAGSLVNRPVTAFWPALLQLPVVSISQFWFLYVLFVMHLAAYLVVPRWGARAFLAIAIVAKLVVPLVAVPVMLRLVMVHGAFYALGVLLGADWGGRLGRMMDTRRNWALPLVIAAMATAWITTEAIIAVNSGRFPQLHSWEISALAWRLPVAPASLVIASGVMAAAIACRGMLASILAYLGRRTMAIFVLHVMFIAGTRIVLTRYWHPVDPVLLLVACVAIGLVAPLAISATARRFTSSRVLGIG